MFQILQGKTTFAFMPIDTNHSLIIKGQYVVIKSSSNDYMHLDEIAIQTTPDISSNSMVQGPTFQLTFG